MRRTQRFGTALAVTCAVLGAVLVAKPSSPIPVTSLIQDLAAGVSPSLQIQSDQKGTYVNGVDSVLSIITTAPGYTHAAGDWYLDAPGGKRTPRLFKLDFSQPTPTEGNLTGGQPNIFPAGLYSGYLKANCDLTGVNLLTLPAQTNGGATVVTCPLAVVFTSNGTLYSVHMNPGITTTGAVEFPETNYMQVTCIYPSTGTCSQFRFDPSGTYTPVGGPTRQANVVRLVPGDGENPVSNLGDYYMSFEIVVMR